MGRSGIIILWLSIFSVFVYLLLISLYRLNKPSFFLKVHLSVGQENCTDSTSLKFVFTTKAELTTGNLSFTVHYPPLTAGQEGYLCVGYGPQGIAQDIKYVVGTASGTIVAGTMQAETDGTVFIFEDPVGPGQFWLWRGYVFNNSFNCQ